MITVVIVFGIIALLALLAYLWAFVLSGKVFGGDAVTMGRSFLVAFIAPLIVSLIIGILSAILSEMDMKSAIVIGGTILISLIGMVVLGQLVGKFFRMGAFRGFFCYLIGNLFGSVFLGIIGGLGIAAFFLLTEFMPGTHQIIHEIVSAVPGLTDYLPDSSTGDSLGSPTDPGSGNAVSIEECIPERDEISNYALPSQEYPEILGVLGDRAVIESMPVNSDFSVEQMAILPDIADSGLDTGLYAADSVCKIPPPDGLSVAALQSEMQAPCGAQYKHTNTGETVDVWMGAPRSGRAGDALVDTWSDRVEHAGYNATGRQRVRTQRAVFEGPQLQRGDRDVWILGRTDGQLVVTVSGRHELAVEIVTSLDRGQEGLASYGSVRPTLYALPHTLPPGWVLAGVLTHRVGPEYAAEKDHARFAQQMVGRQCLQATFWNPTHGKILEYTYFFLQDRSHALAAYNDYREFLQDLESHALPNDLSPEERVLFERIKSQKVRVAGTVGRYINALLMEELNYFKGFYIVALDLTERDVFRQFQDESVSEVTIPDNQALLQQFAGSMQM
ncbi:hypothetical protein JXA80_12145 [bacterium]|nr:hypothetical protein [candidate division CSSED10-310 bacterium]